MRIVLICLLLASCTTVEKGVRGSGEVAEALADVACGTSIANNVDKWFWNMWRAIVPFGGDADNSCEDA